MPRNVRNFWIEGRIKGRKTKISGGPVSKDGGMVFSLSIRHKGRVVKDAILIAGEVLDDGRLSLTVGIGPNGMPFLTGGPDFLRLVTDRS
jgi:hypothetical protein